MRTLWMLALLAIGCGPDPRNNGNGGDDGAATCPSCTEDKSGVVDCDGNVTACPLEQACSEGHCLGACEAAEQNHESVGCDYYAVDMDAGLTPPGDPPLDACFAVFIANTSRAQTHITAEFGARPIDLAMFAKIPMGQGQSLTYAPYNPADGIAPGEVAILFLAYGFQIGNVACPVPAAIGTEAQLTGTGLNTAFHITTDNPVVAYQMLPYGGGKAAATGASLLLPSSAWGTNYVMVSAWDSMALPFPVPFVMGPSHDIVAKEDDTVVTLRPKSAIKGGAGLDPGAAGQPYTFTLMKGQVAQLTQLDPLSGSPISSTKPVGVFGGHQSMGIDRCCADHGEQMIAPVRALGYEYVAAPHAQRKPAPDPRVYHIVGAVDGTALEYDPPGVGPATVGLGEVHEIRTDAPFVVRSQDDAHPFLMFTYMTGAGGLEGQDGDDPNFRGGFGDADFVRLVPPAQFLSHYVFFADPTYPFTVLTVVRARGKQDRMFHDVELDCLAAPLTDWQRVGDYEITYVKLVDHFASVGGCNNGVREMTSKGPFGVWVWGWGSDDAMHTGWVSYGYPAGEGVLPINDVIILSGKL